MPDEKEKAKTQPAPKVDAAPRLSLVNQAVTKKWPQATLVLDDKRRDRVWVKDDFAIGDNLNLTVALAVGGIDPETFSLKRAGPAVAVTFVR
jgi:hypothetical protein